MTTRHQAILRHTNLRVTGGLAPWLQKDLPTTDRYRLDPWAHVDDGHVLIQDVETMQPEIWVPYTHQRELVEAWIDLPHLRETGKVGMPDLRFRNVHEEKSRQMGITWGIAWPLLWALMYHRVSLLAIHEHLAELDDGGRAATLKSLFGRMLFMAKGELSIGNTVWPEDLAPMSYLEWRRAPSVIRNTLRHGFLIAEGAGPDPARGARFHGILLDEAARIPWSEAVHASTRSACPDGRLYNSTPYGTGNTYGRIAKSRPTNFRFLRHHWSIHPVYSIGMHVAGADPESCALCLGNVRGDKWVASEPTCHRYEGKLTSPWYDRAITDMTDEQVAQELEIDYSGALTGRVYPEFNDEIHVRDRIEFDPALPIITSWDYGVLYTAVGIFQLAVGELRQIGELEVQNAYPEKVVGELIDTLADLGVPLVDLEPVFTRDWLGVGDVSAEQKQQTTAETLATAYGRLGFTVQSRRRSIDETIRATKRLLLGRPVPYAVSAETCPKTIDHWRENTWKTDRAGNISPNAREPKNDEHNHMLRGASYLFAWLFPPPTVDEAMGQASMGSIDGGYIDEAMADQRDSLFGAESGGLSPDMGF